MTTIDLLAALARVLDIPNEPYVDKRTYAQREADAAWEAIAEARAEDRVAGYEGDWQIGQTRYERFLDRMGEAW